MLNAEDRIKLTIGDLMIQLCVANATIETLRNPPAAHAAEEPKVPAEEKKE